MTAKQPNKSTKTPSGSNGKGKPVPPASKASGTPAAKSAKASEAKKVAPKTSTEKTPRPAPTGSASALADQLVTDEAAPAKIAELGAQLLDERTTVSTQAARVLGDLTAKKPELLVSLVDKFVKGLRSENKRVVQTAAEALPALARVAPARVARHLETLKTTFDVAVEPGPDGLVRTFANLCTASVAYQKRLEPILTKALRVADPKSLARWTEIVLPALKGEPHARARAVVEERLYDIPRASAQRIADFLGIKLRPAPR